MSCRITGDIPAEFRPLAVERFLPLPSIGEAGGEFLGSTRFVPRQGEARVGNTLGGVGTKWVERLWAEYSAKENKTV
jgi:hypothetical protein